MIQPNSTMLFQGDSITDAGRNRDAAGPNVGLGCGSPTRQSIPKGGFHGWRRGIESNGANL